MTSLLSSLEFVLHAREQGQQVLGLDLQVACDLVLVALRKHLEEFAEISVDDAFGRTVEGSEILVVGGADYVGASQFPLQSLQECELLDFLALEGVEHAHTAIDRTVEDGFRTTFVEMSGLNSSEHFPHIIGNKGVEFIAIGLLDVLPQSS
jgi:hypothetical protein